MKLKGSLFFARSLIFPRTEKKSTARKSIIASIVCVALSIIPLVVVLTMTSSMINGMTDRILELSSGHLKCFIKRRSDYLKSFESFSQLNEKIRKVDGVENSWLEIDSNGLASANSYRTGCQIRAVDFNSFFKNEKINSLLTFENGNLTDEISGEKTAFIGSKISEILSLKPGDSFHLILTKKNQAGTIVPKMEKFTVKGIVSSGYQEIDSLWIFIPVETGFKILPAESSVHTVGISVESPFSMELNQVMGNVQKTVSPHATVHDWHYLNQTKFENFESTRTMLIFIMLLILLVASINISSAIIMLVIERQKEIAILKSLGASASGISFSFIITGFFCGFLGLALGLPFGLLISININEIITFFEKILNYSIRFINLLNGNSNSDYVYLLDPAFYLSKVPVQIPFKEILFCSIFILLISFLVSLIPSVRAGKEKPLKIFSKN